MDSSRMRASSMSGSLVGDDSDGLVFERAVEAEVASRLKHDNHLRARLIAFYLPQFHPIPENDLWWGKGFTEWTYVARARPQFRGHDQPHVPAHLGFYDLRVPEARAAQAELARSYGIEAFCYWHYWFSGKRLLGRPFDEVLTTGEPQLPFCLAWVNEPWTRTWLGQGEVLQDQRYSAEDDQEHARWLARAFADERHVRVWGRPLFLVYRPTYLPDARRTTDTLREECVRQGLPEPYLVGMDAWSWRTDCRALGFDSTLGFEPMLPGSANDGFSWFRLLRNLRLGVCTGTVKVYDYAEVRRYLSRARSKFDFPLYPTIVVSWDNTPRRGKHGTVMLNATPERFESGLRALVDEAEAKPWEERLVFINAWNEWAEGNYLEPDLQSGLRRLEAVWRVARRDADTNARDVRSSSHLSDPGARIQSR